MAKAQWNMKAGAYRARYAVPTEHGVVGTGEPLTFRQATKVGRGKAAAVRVQVATSAGGAFWVDAPDLLLVELEGGH